MKHLLTKIKNNYANDKDKFIRTLLISEGFGFCFSLSGLLGFKIDKLGTAFDSLSGVVITLALSILLGGIVAIGLICMEEYQADKALVCKNTSSRIDVNLWIIFTVILFLCWLPIWLAYYPAVFSYDAEAQLYQVISGNFSTHHPLLHTLVLGLCMKIGFSDNGIGVGMALYAGLQMVIMAALLGWTLAEIRRIKVNKVVFAIYTLFLALFPVNGIFAISTTKDVIFSGLMVVSVLLTRRMFENEFGGIGDAVKLILTLSVMMLFRNNAQYALVLSALILFVFCFRKYSVSRKLIAIYLLSFAIALLIGICLKAGTKAESGSPREALSIPIQQMARVKALFGDELEGELASNLDLLIDDEAVLKYDEHLADPIKERISMKQPGVFVKTWIKLGLKYPGTYFDAWFLTTEGAWYIRDTSCNRIYGEGIPTGFGYLSTDIRNMPEGFEVYNESKLPWLRNALEELVSGNSFERIPILRILFAPALYLWIFLFFIYRSFIYKDIADKICALYVFCYYLTILLSPAILVRYMYPYMLLFFVIGLPTTLRGTENDNC